MPGAARFGRESRRAGFCYCIDDVSGGAKTPMSPRDGSAHAVELAVVEGISKIGREEWNSLVTDDDSPFIEWDWLFAMEESASATRKTGWAPYHLTLREQSSRRLLAACPVYLKSHSMGEFVFDHGWADAAGGAGIKYYPKLLVGVPFTPHTGRRFLTAPGAERAKLVPAMAQALARLCEDNDLSSAHVNFLEEDEAAALVRIGFLERLGYQYHWHNAGFQKFDDYLNRLKHKRRVAVRHERAALDEQGITIKMVAGEEIPDSLFPSMYRLYLSTVDKFYWGRRYLTARFFELARSLKRYLCFVLAYRGNRLIAGTFNVQKAGVLYGRYWGCFEEHRFLHFNVCYYAGIEHCIRAGIKRFEPGAGGEYKWLRGFDPALTRSAHFIAHPGLARAIANYLERERREIMAWIEEGRERSQLKPPPPSDIETE
jgi:predicted N-acyltransferase